MRLRASTRTCPAALAALFLALAALAGCGDPGGNDAGTAPSSAGGDVRPPENERSAATRSLINAFRFEAQGVETAGAPPRPDELSAAGGCRAPNHLSLGFHRGNLQSEDYFYFSMNSSEPIEPGKTGVIEPVGLTWDNGLFRPDDLPPEVDVKIPRRLEGTGRMTLTAHTGVGMAGRMAAEDEGEVRGDAGTARVAVSFDINLACGR